MDDAGVKTIIEKEIFRMVQGAMVLLKGVQFGTLYKLQGSTISDGCNSSILNDIGVEEERIPTVSREMVMMSHQILGHIGENGLQVLHDKHMSNCSLDFDFCEHYVYAMYPKFTKLKKKIARCINAS
jgi:hypothetical protein